MGPKNMDMERGQQKNMDMERDPPSHGDMERDLLKNMDMERGLQKNTVMERDLLSHMDMGRDLLSHMDTERDQPKNMDMASNYQLSNMDIENVLLIITDMEYKQGLMYHLNIDHNDIGNQKYKNSEYNIVLFIK